MSRHKADSLLYSRNWCNTVKKLCPNTIFLKKISRIKRETCSGICMPEY